MNIDQRIEALTARHEALAQSLELLAAMQQDNEKRWEKRFDVITTAIENLTHTAEIQNQRLTRLEDRQQ